MINPPRGVGWANAYDDATSRLMWVRFASTESTFTYFGAMRDYLSVSAQATTYFLAEA